MVTEIKKMAGVNDNAELAVYQNKVQCLESFNNILVHNLRGVAANIKMLVEVLLKVHVYKDGDAEKKMSAFSLEQGLSFIGDSSTSLINILSNLMKGMNLGQNSSIQSEKCDIAEMVDAISSQLNGFIVEKNARLNLMLGVTHIEYPKCYMESLLYNFISNALKYSQPNVPAVINIATYRRDGKTVLSVKDNGLGIDMEKHGDKIFNLGQVFHQGYDSKGMGLYITRQQVESLGGNISVKSEVNGGSEFIVTF
jgi:signal transduction histidine kinase